MPEPSSRAVVLDTDVASRSFKGLLPPRLAARLAGQQPLLTFVTIGELTQWAKLRRWGPRNRDMLDAWLSDKPVIPGAKGIAVLWGELSAGATQRGRPRPVNDTWVAACCLAYGLPLATLNVKDFADFAEHNVRCHLHQWRDTTRVLPSGVNATELTGMWGNGERLPLRPASAPPAATTRPGQHAAEPAGRAAEDTRRRDQRLLPRG